MVQENFLNPKVMKKLSRSNDNEIKTNLKNMLKSFSKTLPKNKSNNPLVVDYYSMNLLETGSVIYKEIFSSKLNKSIFRPLIVFRNDSSPEYPGEFELIDALPLLSFYSNTNGGKTILDEDIYNDVLLRYLFLYNKLIKNKNFKKFKLINVKKIIASKEDFPFELAIKLDKNNWKRMHRALQILSQNKEISISFNDEWSIIKE